MISCNMKFAPDIPQSVVSYVTAAKRADKDPSERSYAVGLWRGLSHEEQALAEWVLNATSKDDVQS